MANVGDNRDFATMGTFSAVVDHYFGSSTRRSLWRSCSSLCLDLLQELGSDLVELWLCSPGALFCGLGFRVKGLGLRFRLEGF